MNTLVEEAKALVEALKDLVSDVKDVDIVVCPPFISLTTVRDVIEGSNIELYGADMWSF